MMWNRLRYTIWAPWYDALVAAADFGEARRRSIGRLALADGDRVLIVGAGTGLDLDYLWSGLSLTAIDVTPAMLHRLRLRAERLGLTVQIRTADARRLPFAGDSFDAVLLHLVLAVMPQPDQGLREVARVLRPAGRVSVFDKFLRDDQRPSMMRWLLNPIMKLLFTDMNRRLGPLLRGTELDVERDEPAAFGGFFRTIVLKKAGRGPQPEPDRHPAEST
jgi:phosphatidylethanolamine/phosphatidyl-N-methylethanolamine N-methyltransferase